MKELNVEATQKLLNRIMEFELAGVVRYTHYSLMVAGPNRIPIVQFMKAQATESLLHASTAGEILVGLQDMPGPLDLAAGEDGGQRWFEQAADGIQLAVPGGSGRIDGEERIQSQIFERAAVAISRCGDLEDAARRGGQAGGQAGEGAHEGGIHAAASAEIHDQAGFACGDALLAECFQCGAVYKRAFPFAADPTESSEESDRNRVASGHNKAAVVGAARTL